MKQEGEARLKPQTAHTPWTWRIMPRECNLNATQLAPEVQRGAVWIRCAQERTSANPLECGLARPEPQYTRYWDQHVLAASGVREPDKNASLKRR